jgi:hypothetical protein
MDDSTASVVAAIIGAGAALLVGTIGAAIATLPIVSLEKRQARKDAREAVRLLLGDFIERIYDYALHHPNRPAAESAIAGTKLVTISAQLGLVLRRQDEPIFDHVTAGVGLIVMNDGNGMVNTLRLAIAASMADQLPKWYRGALDMKKITLKTSEYKKLQAHIRSIRTAAASDTLMPANTAD